MRKAEEGRVENKEYQREGEERKERERERERGRRREASRGKKAWAVSALVPGERAKSATKGEEREGRDEGSGKSEERETYRAGTRSRRRL